VNDDDLAELREIEETARVRRAMIAIRASLDEERRRAKVAPETPGAVAATEEAVEIARAAHAAAIAR
jgi:hypothetical protein